MELNLKPFTRTDIKPRLEVQMSWWAMTGVCEDRRKLSLEEKFYLIAEAGFDGINGFLPERSEAEQWIKLLDRYGLSFSVNAYPKNISDLINFLDTAELYQDRIQFINAQVLTPFLTDHVAEELLCEIDVKSRESGIPVYIETHRGTITQDLIRTALYIEKINSLKLTIDFSHYVLAGEMRSITDEAEMYFHRLLKHTASIHARISNGEQIQVNIGPNGEHEMLQHFIRWWKLGMSNWLKAAKQGDTFPFICELGPPPYAITLDEYINGTKEISERWKQSLFFANLARSIWNELDILQG